VIDSINKLRASSDSDKTMEERERHILSTDISVLLSRQVAKLSRYGCNPSWFCSPHDTCFIHELCLCEGSSRWPPVKLVHSSWVSKSYEWLAAILSRWLLPTSSFWSLRFGSAGDHTIVSIVSPSSIVYALCYVLTLPLLFLIPCHPFTSLSTRLPIPGTALP